MYGVQDMFYDLAIYAGRVLNLKSRSLKIFNTLSRKSYFFKIIHFLQEHKEDLIPLGGDQFKLLSLDEVFSMKSYNLDALDLYFKEKDRIKFFKRGSRIFAKVKQFVFVLPFPHGIYEIVETFYNECYGGINIQNGNVVDIGAFIGDTAIYFASRGAKKVIAFEPAKNLFRIADQNVQLNGLDKIIQLRNEAVGINTSEENFYFVKSHPGASSMLLPRGKNFICYKVRVVPLSNVTVELDHIDLLKIDCEGTEDAILLQAYKNGLLKDISSIIIEVHDQEKLKTVVGIFEKASFKIVKCHPQKATFLVSAIRA